MLVMHLPVIDVAHVVTEIQVAEIAGEETVMTAEAEVAEAVEIATSPVDRVDRTEGKAAKEENVKPNFSQNCFVRENLSSR
jgi:hypothetical protein